MYKLIINHSLLPYEVASIIHVVYIYHWEMHLFICDIYLCLIYIMHYDYIFIPIMYKNVHK